MNRFCLIAAGISLLFLSAACQKKIPKGSEARADKEINEALANGKTLTDFQSVPDSDAKLGKIIGLVDAPVDSVWKCVADLDNYKEFMPFFRKSEVLEVKGRSVMFYSMVTMPLPLFPELWAVQKINFKPDEYFADFSMVEGSLAKTFGSWKLEPFALDPKKTKITYEALIDPGSKFLSTMADFAASTLMPMIIESIRERVAEHHYELKVCPPYARTEKMREKMKGIIESDELNQVM